MAAGEFPPLPLTYTYTRCKVQAGHYAYDRHAWFHDVADIAMVGVVCRVHSRSWKAWNQYGEILGAASTLCEAKALVEAVIALNGG